MSTLHYKSLLFFIWSEYHWMFLFTDWEFLRPFPATKQTEYCGVNSTMNSISSNNNNNRLSEVKTRCTNHSGQITAASAATAITSSLREWYSQTIIPVPGGISSTRGTASRSSTWGTGRPSPTHTTRLYKTNRSVRLRVIIKCCPMRRLRNFSGVKAFYKSTVIWRTHFLNFTIGQYYPNTL